MENVVKSVGKVKNNAENILFSGFASERSERANFFFILTNKLNGKMVKSMGNMKINNENKNLYDLISEQSERAEIFRYFNTSTERNGN